MSYDSNNFEFDSYDDDYDDMDPENEEASGPREIFGLSMKEIAILGFLLMVIVVFGGFIALSVINKPSVETEIQPTIASSTPEPSLTPFVQSTPIPDWNRFEFADAQAEIWLPSSCQGGDPVAYPEIINMTIDVFIQKETYAEYAKGLLDDPAMVFFAFDPDPNAVWRSMHVSSFPLTTTEFEMGTYLDQTIEQASERNIRITNQYLTDFDYYSDVGVLIFEEHKEIVAGEIYLFKFYVFAIKIDDAIWHLEYQVLRDDAAKYQETIFNSARSFYVQP